MLTVEEKSSFGPRDNKSLHFSAEDGKLISENFHALEKYGFSLDHDSVSKMAEFATEMGYGMDASPVAPFATTGSITTPAQFLQNWLPGFILDLTQYRPIDDLVGIVTQGSWEDEEIVQPEAERMGTARLYTDYGNAPTSSYNVNYIRRTVVRHEIGMEVGNLEAARAARVRATPSEFKRMACARELEIIRNNIGFRGYNDGANRTYGFLTDPNLPDYIPVSGGTWDNKTFQQIKNDILAGFNLIHTQSGANIDPEKMPLTLALPTSRYNLLNQVTDFAVSVKKWLQENYPNTRVISVPLLDGANGGANVFYLFAETVGNTGTDDDRTFVQVVPTKFLTLGVERRAKSYLEDYSNATSGLLLKRPYALVRYTGI